MGFGQRLQLHGYVFFNANAVPDSVLEAGASVSHGKERTLLGN